LSGPLCLERDWRQGSCWTTSRAIPRPTATSTSPSKTTAVGTFDQPKRRSSALTTSNAVHQRYTPATMIFCRGSGSAVGPPFIRRRRTSGLLKAQQIARPRRYEREYGPSAGWRRRQRDPRSDDRAARDHLPCRQFLRAGARRCTRGVEPVTPRLGLLDLRCAALVASMRR
jgi:hypothetical protein